jgi:hypothetical protein
MEGMTLGLGRKIMILISPTKSFLAYAGGGRGGEVM